MIRVRDVLFLAGGIAIGLYVAKLYARSQVNDAIKNSLDTFGLGKYAGQVEGLVTPAVVG